METYLGLDFGGTKLLIGEVTATGEILCSQRYNTGVSSREEAAKVIRHALEDYRSRIGWRGELQAAGVGIVGVTDHKRGLWISINHEVTGPAMPLADMVGDIVGVPTIIDNDVRSATTAEMLHGHGKRSHNFVYINVGTGVAAGMVIDGKIMRGAHNNSGEVGHFVCDSSDHTPCVCGREGCVENVISGVGFARQYELLRGEYPHTRITPMANGSLHVPELFALADEGDPLAKRMAEHGAATLANLIMNLVRVSDPDLVVLGGGIVSDGWLLNRVKKLLNPSTMRGVTGGVVLSALDSGKVGLIGAASLGMRLMMKKRKTA